MSNHTVQYTIRNVPPAFDVRLKAQAKKQGVSLNTIILSRLGALPDKKPPRVHYDLDFLIGSMTVQEADELDDVIRQARETDRKLAKQEYEASKKPSTK